MKIRRLVQASSVTGVAAFLMAASASTNTAQYETIAAITGFGYTSLPLNNSLSASATLTVVLSLVGGGLLGLSMLCGGKRSSSQ